MNVEGLLHIRGEFDDCTMTPRAGVLLSLIFLVDFSPSKVYNPISHFPPCTASLGGDSLETGKSNVSQSFLRLAFLVESGVDCPRH